MIRTLKFALHYDPANSRAIGYYAIQQNAAAPPNTPTAGHPYHSPNSCTAHSPSLQRKNLGIHRRFLSHYDEVTRQPVPNDQYALRRSATIAGSSGSRSSLLHNFHQGRGAGSTGSRTFPKKRCAPEPRRDPEIASVVSHLFFRKRLQPPPQ